MPSTHNLLYLTLSALALSTNAVTPGHYRPARNHVDARQESGYHTFGKREFQLIKQSDILESYDYIIAGGGTAGLVLASRLSEDPKTTVLVLEAGLSGDAAADRINAPAGAYYSSIVGTEYDWGHVSVSQPNLAGRNVYWARGKTLGGSSAMNAMYLVRPPSEEIDALADILSKDDDTKNGASTWKWDNYYPYMKKSENFTAPQEEAWTIGGKFAFDASTHGSGGPMQLSYPAVMFTLSGNWTKALAHANIPELEHPNGGTTMGGFITPSSINPHNLTRSYSRPAYIDSLPPRSNLHILTEATVTKIGFSEKAKDGDNLIATHVEYASAANATAYSVKVHREVILSGGPLGSPKILMHSGVGPQDVLSQVGVDVAKELPGVGQHVQDHVTAGIVWTSLVETAGDVHQGGSDFSKTPEFLSAINDAVAFIGNDLLFGENSDRFKGEIASAFDDSVSKLVPSSSPEVVAGYKEIYNLIVNQFWDKSPFVEMLMSIITPGEVSIQSAIQHPFSRGHVYINSTNPFDPIQIDPGYFTHFADRIVMRQGVKLVRRVGEGYGEMLGAETAPGPGVQTDEQIDEWLTNTGASTQYHAMGGCVMLPRKLGGVVDSKLKVYGLANVRVVDSSVYPFEFASHLASPTYGLGESAADIIKKEGYTVPDRAADGSNAAGMVLPGGRGAVWASLLVVGVLALVV